MKKNKNEDLYVSNNSPMTLGELKIQIDEILERVPEFINAQVYAEGIGVRHRISGLIKEMDCRKGGRQEYFLTFLDEEGVAYEKGEITKID